MTLTEIEKRLIDAANAAIDAVPRGTPDRRIMDHTVGCAAQCSDGRIFTGINVFHFTGKNWLLDCDIPMYCRQPIRDELCLPVDSVPQEEAYWRGYSLIGGPCAENVAFANAAVCTFWRRLQTSDSYSKKAAGVGSACSPGIGGAKLTHVVAVANDQRTSLLVISTLSSPCLH